MKNSTAPCAVEGCDRDAYHKTLRLCRPHLDRLRRSGGGPTPTVTLQQRFDRTPKTRTASGCLEWNGGRTGVGYGSIGFQRKSLGAHRVAWELANGRTIPAGMVILHSCDNRCCVEPSHLSLGTVADNNADMARKGRGVRGERNRSAKLTEADVLDVRKRRSEGEPLDSLAREYGTTTGAIWQIVHRYTWKHVA